MDFLKIDSEKSFEKLSLELFNFHHRENENYRNFCDNINIDDAKKGVVSFRSKTSIARQTMNTTENG